MSEINLKKSQSNVAGSIENINSKNIDLRSFILQMFAFSLDKCLKEYSVVSNW